MKRSLTILAVAAAAAIGLAVPASAASVDAFETDAKGQDFGQNPNQAAVFGSDILTVSGRQNNNGDSDYLSFDSFAAGTSSLDFAFTNPGGEWGGFNIRIKTSPFKNSNDWWPLVFSDSVGGVTNASPKTISYVLDGYTGPLHVAIDFYQADFRNGNGLAYMITKTGAPAGPSPAPSPSAVPLPAGLPLVMSGLAALALLRLPRKGRGSTASKTTAICQA